MVRFSCQDLGGTKLEVTPPEAMKTQPMTVVPIEDIIVQPPKFTGTQTTGISFQFMDGRRIHFVVAPESKVRFYYRLEPSNQVVEFVINYLPENSENSLVISADKP